LKNYFIALRINQEIGEKGNVAMCYGNIGQIYSEHGNYPETMKNLSAVLKIFEKNGDKNGMAIVLTNIGNVYLFQRNYSEAIRTLFSALKLSEEIGNKEGTSTIYSCIGNYYQGQGNYPEALKNHFIALKVRKELGSKSLIGGSYMNIGNVYLEQKKYNESSRYLNKALSIVKEVGAMLGILECCKSLARLDSAQGNFARSLEHYKKYIAARDSVFGEEKTKKLKQVEFEQKELVARAEQEKKDDLALKELQRQKLIRNGLIIGMLLFAVVGFLLFRSWKLRKKVEKQHAIIQERMRISADLHDDIGSGLSQISLLSELVRKEVQTPEGKKEAAKIVSTSKNLLESMD